MCDARHSTFVQSRRERVYYVTRPLHGTMSCYLGWVFRPLPFFCRLSRMRSRYKSNEMHQEASKPVFLGEGS